MNPLPVFKTGALNHSATLPALRCSANSLARVGTGWQRQPMSIRRRSWRPAPPCSDFGATSTAETTDSGHGVKALRSHGNKQARHCVLSDRARGYERVSPLRLILAICVLFLFFVAAYAGHRIIAETHLHPDHELSPVPGMHKSARYDDLGALKRTQGAAGSR